MSDLGQVLNDEQIDIALKDLDLNKDGVIDMLEFKRWYFSGMKSYDGTKRNILKIGAKTRAIKDALADEAKNILLA